MSVTAEQLSDFSEKSVILSLRNEDGEVEQVEGKIEAASEAGVAFRVKGKSSIELVEPKNIEDIEALPEKPKPVTQKRIDPVDISRVRQHLVDRHGVPLSWAKENTDEDAHAYHESLDHSDLGHRHELKKEKASARDEALADETPEAEEAGDPSEY